MRTWHQYRSVFASSALAVFSICAGCAGENGDPTSAGGSSENVVGSQQASPDGSSLSASGSGFESFVVRSPGAANLGITLFNLALNNNRLVIQSADGNNIFAELNSLDEGRFRAFIIPGDTALISLAGGDTWSFTANASNPVGSAPVRPADFVNVLGGQAQAFTIPGASRVRLTFVQNDLAPGQRGQVLDAASNVIGDFANGANATLMTTDVRGDTVTVTVTEGGGFLRGLAFRDDQS
jgi:hypothetical protein